MEELTQIQKVVSLVIDFCVRYSFQILGALIILGIGFYVAGWVSRLVISLCEKKKIDITLSLFLGRLSKLVILAFVLIMALGKFGISVAPLIAALGAVAFGASFALQGPLSNYGAGLAIILTRPFKVGDTISLLGVSGIVEEVALSATMLSTEDGEEITIPNKQIVGEILTNSFDYKVVEATVGISYDDDPEAAIRIIKTILSETAGVPDEPAPQIGIEAYGDSAISIGMRYWVPTKEYFNILYAVNLDIYRKLKAEGITLPFPQREVRILSSDA